MATKTTKFPVSVGYEIIDIWAVHKTVNERGEWVPEPDCYAVDAPAADEAAKGLGWHGGYGHVKQMHGIKIGDRVFPVLSVFPVELKTKGQSIRTRALSKLTDEERKELGLS